MEAAAAPHELMTGTEHRPILLGTIPSPINDIREGKSWGFAGTSGETTFFS